MDQEIEPFSSQEEKNEPKITKPTCSSAGWASVKQEFLCLPNNSSSFETLAENRGNLTENPQEKPRHVRGQNRNRRKTKRPSDSSQLCPTLISTGEKFGQCKFGPKKCRFMHDARKYWDEKPEDILSGLKCPFFQGRGRCPFGISCRFAGEHTDAENLESSVDGKKWDFWKCGPFPRGTSCNSRFVEKNCVSSELLKELRQHRYDFRFSEKYIQSLTREKDETVEEDREDFEKSQRLDLLEAKKPSQKHDSEVGQLVGVADTERKTIDWNSKLYLAPLTTVGNLPFRRICVDFGAEVTCSEMAMGTSLLQGTQSEWSLVKRHESESVFGVQLCGSHTNSMMMASQVLAEQTEIDFVDVNLGCPLDLVCDKGAGCSLMGRATRLKEILGAMDTVLRPKNISLTVKLRTGQKVGQNTTHTLLRKLTEWEGDQGATKVALYTLHGRSKEQRYTKLADWTYIQECAKVVAPSPMFGCGDILSFEDYYRELAGENSKISGIMVARGALIKPWIFTEIKEKRHWDISSEERMEILRKFVKYGLEHWGSDQQGVEKTRRFLLEWLSFTHRYIPVGILETVPQRINEKPPKYLGRNDLETLMASSRSSDWVKISELILGPVPEEFQFLTKHKANSY